MTQAVVANDNDAKGCATFTTITVNPFVPAIGAEIFGTDLSRPLSERQFQEIHDVLMAHKVVFFHDQQLDGTRTEMAARLDLRPADVESLILLLKTGLDTALVRGLAAPEQPTSEKTGP